MASDTMPVTIDFYMNSIAERVMNLGTGVISPFSSPSIKLLYVLGYYRYINANDANISVLERSIFMEEKYKARIGAVFFIDDDPPTYDVLCPLYLKDKTDIDIEALSVMTREIVQEFVNPDQSTCPKSEISACAKIQETDVVSFKIVTNAELSPERKAEIRRKMGKLELPFSTWSIDIVCGDDIIEEISAAEDPQKYVETDSLVLFEPKDISYHGPEKSFVSSISAMSLRDLYRSRGTKGLFASNLRFYVKSLKIDAAIEETIKKHPDDFWYFNNGIIITCTDYSIEGNKLNLKNFSIVNGGQTTNIIGNSDFTHDFAVLCKVIRERHAEDETTEEFLEGVAAASNSQKPIKPKDLIANRPEQKHLKALLADHGIFLQVKRGDRINKVRYPQIWQSSTNDEVAQLVYAGIFQNPTVARNSVSKLFSNEQIYRAIFLQETSGFFYRDLILLRSAYQEWISPKNKKGQYHPVRPELAKVAMLYQVGAILLISKSFYNKQLIPCVRASEGDHAKIQFFIGQRDVGFSRILKTDCEYSDLRDELFRLFCSIEYELLIEGHNAYQRYKGSQGGSAANFVRDSNYYRSLVAFPLLTSVMNKIDCSVLHRPSRDEQQIADRRFVSDYRPGLKMELLSYRKMEASKLGKSEQSFMSDSTVNQIVRLTPRNNHELASFTKLSQQFIEKHGKEITGIVKKYDDVSSGTIVITSTNRFHP